MINSLVGQKPEVGVMPLLYAATAPDVNGGEYYGPDGFMEYSGKTHLTQCAAGVYDEAVAAELWKASENILNHVLSLQENRDNHLSIKPI